MTFRASKSIANIICRAQYSENTRELANSLTRFLISHLQTLVESVIKI